MSFLQWFENHVRQFPTTTFVDLIHVRSSNTSARIQRWPLPKKDPSSLASGILVHAQEAAEAMHTAQTFAVALVDEGEKTLIEHVMRVGDAMGTARAFDSEAPDMSGMLKQQMRHNEAIMRGYVTASRDSIDALLRENERIRLRNEILELRHEEHTTLREDLSSKQHERDLSTYRTQKQEQRNDEIVNTLKVMVPSIAGKMLSQRAPPDPGITALADSLSPEQVQNLGRILRPDQLAALSLIFHKAKTAGQASGGNSGNGGNDKAN